MMKKKYRIGLVGFAHMHVLDQIKPFFNHAGAGGMDRSRRCEANGGIRIL